MPYLSLKFEGERQGNFADLVPCCADRGVEPEISVVQSKVPFAHIPSLESNVYGRSLGKFESETATPE